MQLSLSDTLPAEDRTAMAFPGINPYIEGQAWPSFHHDFISGVYRALIRSLRGRYVVRVEVRVYVEYAPDPEPTAIVPDVAVMKGDRPRVAERGGAALAEPVLIPIAMPETVQEAYLTVRLPTSLELVTVIELLSP